MRDTVEVLAEEERLKGIMGGKPKMNRLSEGLANSATSFDRCRQTTHQKRVEQFMCLAGQTIPNRPTMPDLKTRKLRASLILEEALETIQALGMIPHIKDAINHGLIPIEPKDEIIWMGNPGGPSLVDIADGCADLSVVTIGTLSACGISDKPILEIVDQNNLEKFGPGHSIREDGKLVKPKGHTPPTEAIIWEIERQLQGAKQCENSPKLS